MPDWIQKEDFVKKLDSEKVLKSLLKSSVSPIPEVPCFWETDLVEEVSDTARRGKRRYVGTYHNWTETGVALLIEWATKRCLYFVAGYEICPHTQTPHIQFYMEFRDQILKKTILKQIGLKFWLGHAKAAPVDAAGYCKKGEAILKPKEQYRIFFPRTKDFPAFKPIPERPKWIYCSEIGEISHQGKRTEIDDCVEHLLNGNSIQSLAREFPAQFVKFHRGFKELSSNLLIPRCLKEPPQVIVLWGPTGTGKTHDAYHKYFPDVPHHFWKSSSGNWFDGYAGQLKMILDEFRGQMPWSDILSLLDRYECPVQIKGGFTQVQCKYFVITSPCPPDQWYFLDSRYDQFSQLERRITHVEKMEKKYVESKKKPIPVCFRPPVEVAISDPNSSVSPIPPKIKIKKQKCLESNLRSNAHGFIDTFLQ